jgi:nucleoside-diphosphate-sugar epimerase
LAPRASLHDERSALFQQARLEVGLTRTLGKIVVTGAGGFIGRALCARLKRTGVAYVGAVRTLDPRFADPEFVALGDFAAADWDGVLAGADAVVHLAGRAHVPLGAASDAATLYVLGNVHVTRRLAEAAARAHVRRIVFASSAKVYGETTRPGRPFGPDDIAAPQDPYARSKAEAESVLRAVCSEHGVEAVILRMPLTYGPGVRGNFLALLEAVARERRLPLAGIDNRRSLLYQGNAVSAIEAALRAPALAGTTLPVADAQSVSTPELVRKLAAALRVRARIFRVPAAALRGMSSLVGRRADLQRLLGSLEVDSSRFRELARWSPPYSLDEGLAATAAWWRMRATL